MITKHFPFFLAAAEEANFQRASDRLNIAQSALSRHISALEEDLGGVKLFERLPRGVRLTESGEQFLSDVRRIIADVDSAILRAQRMERGQTGHVRVAFTEAAAARPLLSQALAKFQAWFPEVQINLIAMRSPSQRVALRKGQIDLGFLYAEPGDDADFDFIDVLTDDFLLAVPKGHRLASKPEIILKDLAGEPLIFPSKLHAPSIHERTMQEFRKRAMTPNIVAENPSTDTMNCLVSAGIGVGFLIVSQKERMSANVVVRGISDFSLPLQLVLAWLKGSRSPIAPSFVKAVCESEEAQPIALSAQITAGRLLSA